MQLAQVNAAAGVGGHHLGQRQAVGPGAKAVTIGAAAQGGVQHALRPTQTLGGLQNSFRLGAIKSLSLVGKLRVVQGAGVLMVALAAGDGSQPRQGFPLFWLARGALKHWRAVARMVAP